MARIYISAFLTLVVLAAALPAKAQDVLPTLPKPIRNLVDEGAQIRFLGKDYGLDAWITIKNGQEQYFYVMPDGKSFVMGVLFDDEGKVVTVRQVQRLREKGDPLLDELTEDLKPQNEISNKEAFEFKSPSERLFQDIENSNWIPFGAMGAPVMYSFIDPQCPHCHAFISDLRSNNMIENGRVQLRIIPVGFREETRAQAAFLLASPNPQERFFKHMDGDKSALPAKAEINQQGVQRNLALMQSWKLDVTPLIVYRDKSGGIKIVRGRPKDINSLLGDIGDRG